MIASVDHKVVTVPSVRVPVPVLVLEELVLAVWTPSPIWACHRDQQLVAVYRAQIPPSHGADQSQMCCR